MPFGLVTAFAKFEQLMFVVFTGMLYNTCLAYFYNIIIFKRTFTRHLERLELALKRFRTLI